MSLESNLQSTLETVCDRVFPDYAPNGTQTPYITWMQVGGEVLQPLENDVSGKRNARIQVNVWSTRRKDTVDLMLQVESALIATELFIARQQGAPISSISEDDDLRGMFQYFSIWADIEETSI